MAWVPLDLWADPPPAPPFQGGEEERALDCSRGPKMARNATLPSLDEGGI
ncbi:hypothetical protein H4W01_000881 [Sphingomonas sp. PL20]